MLWEVRDALRIDILIKLCTLDIKNLAVLMDCMVWNKSCVPSYAQDCGFFLFLTPFHNFSILVIKLFHSVFLTIPFFFPHKPSHNKKLTFSRNKGLSPHGRIVHRRAYASVSTLLDLCCEVLFLQMSSFWSYDKSFPYRFCNLF